ncbi:MAG: hypothetical protein JJ900_15725 [Rhodospirillales bacterium]|nr:hypothetical protein [Rhodospirillales bacterium]MBO6788297.1 hypothetical protein [Rhodospirillales bacterium]
MIDFKGFAVALLLVAAAVPVKAEDLQFTLINSTRYVITQMQISPVSAGDWGENILGRDVLLQGETATVTIADGSTACAYDMLLTFNDGETIEERNYDFCDLKSYEATD